MEQQILENKHHQNSFKEIEIDLENTANNIEYKKSKKNSKSACKIIIDMII